MNWGSNGIDDGCWLEETQGVGGGDVWIERPPPVVPAKRKVEDRKQKRGFLGEWGYKDVRTETGEEVWSFVTSINDGLFGS